MLIGVEGDEEESIENVVVEELEEDEEGNTVNISLNSAVGSSNPKTMKLLGKIGNDELVVMVDYGATNNFISKLIVQRLIPCEDCERFGVVLVNGVEIRGQGNCRQLCVTTAGDRSGTRFSVVRTGKHKLDFGNTVARNFGNGDNQLEDTSDEFHVARKEGEVGWKPSSNKGQDFFKSYGEDIKEGSGRNFDRI